MTTPFSVQALDSEKIGQNVDLGTNMEIAQYRRNQNQNRQFSVYYRSPRDSRSVREASRSEKRLRQRQWTLEGYHPNRQAAQQAANRLQRRGYRTYIQVSRRVNAGMGRG